MGKRSSAIVKSAKAQKGTASIKRTKITAKQRAARKVNIEVARRSKKKTSTQRAQQSTRVGAALGAASMNMKTASIKLSGLSYKQEKFIAKRGKPSKVLSRKIKDAQNDYSENAAFIKKYKNRKTF